MRKFFSVRSNSTTGNNDKSPNSLESSKGDDVYWEKPWQSDGEDTDWSSSVNPKNPILKFTKRCSEKEDPGESRLRRSQSFSSASRFSGLLEGQFDLLVSASSCGHNNAARHAGEYPVCSHSLTPELLPKYERRDLSAVRNEHAPEKIDSPSSCKDYHETSGKSADSSPVPLKCRASRVTQVSDRNKILDLYVDGVQQERRPNNQRLFSSITNDACLVENRVLVNSGRPPQAHSTAPSSPTCSKENMNSPSLGDVKDFHHFLSIQDWAKGDSKPIFPQKHRKRLVQKLSHALNERSRMKSREYDSETTTTIEDIYEDTSELQQGLYSNGSAMNCGLSGYPNSCMLVNGRFSRTSLDSQEQNCDIDDCPWSLNSEDDTVELNIKLKEAEERFILMSEIDIEPVKLDNGNLCIPALLQMVKDINGDRKNLALELLTQVQHRIAERCAAREALKQAKIDFGTRIKRLEREKSELQSSLEKELDRRSTDWSSKLEKFQAEEQRLRDRVRELAEQNVSLQREVSSLSGREAETRSMIINLEMQLNDLTTRLDVVKTENHNLQQALSELQERSETAEADRNCIERNYKAKEKENKDLQTIVVRFQRMCSEHEKTIAGLRLGYSDKNVTQLAERSDLVSSLQLEQIRLSGVEQTLRKEIESCRHEMKLLRHENASLLERLQNGGRGSGFSFRLEHEMHDRLECLQNQGMSLIHENNELCGKLLDLVKSTQLKHGQEGDVEFDGYYVVEYELKFQGLRRGIENLRRSLQTLSLVLNEKSHLDDEECQSWPTESGLSKQWKNQMTEDNIKLELKAETLLTRVLREKLCSKELELEQLQSELASSVRGHEILRVEIQRLQDELSSLNHRAKEMELQMMKKDENFNQLNHNFEECAKELAVSKDTLPKVSNERDHLWEEVKRLKEMDMLLNFEVDSLRKKIETLEEDILMKEGQITILKDSLANKSSDILCEPDL